MQMTGWQTQVFAKIRPFLLKTRPFHSKFTVWRIGKVCGIGIELRLCVHLETNKTSETDTQLTDTDTQRSVLRAWLSTDISEPRKGDP